MPNELEPKIQAFNLRVANLLKEADASDMVEILKDEKSIIARHNQNQNQGAK